MDLELQADFEHVQRSNAKALDKDVSNEPERVFDTGAEHIN